jgi:hypothetical protein
VPPFNNMKRENFPFETSKPFNALT